MSSNISIFIHCALLQGIEDRLNQFIYLIKKSGLFDITKNIFICHVGKGEITWKSDNNKIQYLHVSDELSDFELPTQRALWNYAHNNPEEKILYLHTKGVGKERNECIEDWINYMLFFCVEQYKDSLNLLETNDTVGVDLLNEPVLHYSGNFWWANAKYISTLPEPFDFSHLSKYPNPLQSSRHNQEFWICYNKQKHACLMQSRINCYERHLHKFPRDMYDLKLNITNMQMSKSLCLFFLTGNYRQQFLPTIIENLSKCKYKHEIQLLILTNNDDNQKIYIDLLKDKNIDFIIHSFDDNDNYMKKVRFALHYTKEHGIPYMMKHDNDILCSNYMYDYLLENKDILQKEKNLLLSPTLTSGIPTVEQFLSDFCLESERSEMYSLFIQHKFDHICGVNFTTLNQYTIFSKNWNAAHFFQGVKQIQHPYRGIHPVRFYDQAIYKLNDLVLKYKNNIMEKRQMNLIYDNFCPYFCNSIYIIRSDIYNKIMNTPELFIDPFDEVPINQYKNLYNLNIVYTQNGAAIHPIYNSVAGNDAYEKEFMKRYNSI